MRITPPNQTLQRTRLLRSGFGHESQVCPASREVVLCSLDYFDLARLPYAPHTDDWLYQIYRPLERFRHLW